MAIDPKQELFSLMQRLSQEGYNAKWMTGTHEHKLWDAVLNGPAQYGQTYIGSETISQLKNLSNKAGGWWIYDKNGNDFRFLKLGAWKKYFSPECARDTLSEVIEDTNIYTAKRTYFIYNKQCPICRGALSPLRKNKTRPRDIVLIDISIQKSHPLYHLSKKADFGTGPVIFEKMKVYQGVNAINFIFELPRHHAYFSLPKRIRLLVSYLLHRWFPWFHPKDPENEMIREESLETSLKN